MPIMLPPAPASARSIVGVANDLLAALRGESAWLAPARSVVLVVIDGLGALALRSHAGHSRTLSSAMGRKDVGHAVFPSTTAAALTSILTGVAPGLHGLVGYRIRDPRRDVLFNQLTDWEKAGIDPATWQGSPTVFERASDAGHLAFAVGLSDYARSGFTRAVLRGADYVAGGDPAERVARAYELAATHEGALVYCYLPEADKAGHSRGIDSPAWIAALEEIDAALSTRIPDRVGVLVTADHGMIDVPAHRQLVIDPDDPVREGVAHIGGEPRMLHVYLDPGADADAAATRWQRTLGAAADVGTRAQVIASGLFGPVVTDAAAARIGEVLVAARGNRAIYDGAADPTSRGMVGQHGALTPEERMVPLIRLGAFTAG